MPQTEKDNAKSSLSDFDFDSPEDWFGEESTKPSKKDITATLKKAGLENSKDEDGEGGEATKLDKTKDKPKVESKVEEDEEDFGTSDFDDEEENVVEAKPKEEKKKPVSKVEDKKVEKKEDKKEEEDEDEEEEDEDDDEFYTNLATGLKEEGLFTKVDIKAGKKLTKEDFKSKFEEELELRLDEEIDSALDEFVESMDDDAKRFIKFKKSGGNTADFFKIAQKAPAVDKFDPENKDQVKKVILHHLTAVEGKDVDEAQELYEFYETGGKATGIASKYFAVDKKRQEEEAKLIEDKRKASEKKRKEDSVKFEETLEDAITKTDSIKGVALSKQDKKTLKNYINKPSVETNGRLYPPLVAKINEVLSAKTPEAVERLLLLAKLFKDDFDFSDVEKEAEGKVADRVIRGLDSAKKGNLRAKKNRVNVGKSLADRFE